jgi:hypothetical protein
MERKRVFYYSFEDLYYVSENPQSETSRLAKAVPVEAGILAVVLLEYYGFEPLTAFTIVNNAPQGAPHIIFHEGNEENIVFQVLKQNIEKYNNYYDAIEKTIEGINMEIEEEGGLGGAFGEMVIDMIGIIIYDGIDTGIAIGVPMPPRLH